MTTGRRALNEDELMVLRMIQEAWGPQNSEAEVFFMEDKPFAGNRILDLISCVEHRLPPRLIDTRSVSRGTSRYVGRKCDSRSLARAI